MAIRAPDGANKYQYSLIPYLHERRLETRVSFEDIRLNLMFQNRKSEYFHVFYEVNFAAKITRVLSLSCWL